MTECERLIANGTFSLDFFKPEVRCGFLVTTERKKIWAIELNLLAEFDRVCKKHGLTYFLFVGSLLGAVRHKGFIPWDDDIDLAMPRDDYEAMLKLSGEFQHPLYLQSPWTDAKYFWSFAKLRNSNTSFISEKFMYAGFNQGIQLDFHPIDAWKPEEDGESTYNEIQRLAYDNSTYMRIGNPYLTEEDKIRIQKYNGIEPKAACERMRVLGMKWHGQKTDFVCRNTMGIYGYKRNLFQRSDFSSTIDWDFEGLRFPIPIGYDRILKTLYGDYLALPPIEKRGCWHKGIIINPDTPYSEIVEAYVQQTEKSQK